MAPREGASLQFLCECAVLHRNRKRFVPEAPGNQGPIDGEHVHTTYRPTGTIQLNDSTASISRLRPASLKPTVQTLPLRPTAPGLS